ASPQRSINSTKIRRSTVEVEVSQKVHAHQSIDILVSQRKHRHGEARCGDAEYAELGHAEPIAVLLADGRMHLRPLEAVAPRIPQLADDLRRQRGGGSPVSSTSRASAVRSGPTTSASTMISSRS